MQTLIETEYQLTRILALWTKPLSQHQVFLESKFPAHKNTIKKRCIVFYWKPISELQSVTCRMESHSVKLLTATRHWRTRPASAATRTWNIDATLRLYVVGAHTRSQHPRNDRNQASCLTIPIIETSAHTLQMPQ